jgi:hypothetical protein
MSRLRLFSEGWLNCGYRDDSDAAGRKTPEMVALVVDDQVDSLVVVGWFLSRIGIVGCQLPPAQTRAPYSNPKALVLSCAHQAGDCLVEQCQINGPG